MTARCGSSTRLLLLIFLSCGGAPATANHQERDDGQHLNVYDAPLEPCSASGMAMAGEYGAIRAGNDTGGYCTGNYSICVDLSTVEGGEDLCQALEEGGQSSLVNDASPEDLKWWCDQDQLACHDQPEEQCPIESWCLSPDAFALYVSDLADEGGCDGISDIACKSIHQGAVWALLDESRNSTIHATAIACLIDRCGMYRLSALTSKSSGHHTFTDLVGYGAALGGVMLAALLIMHRTAREPDIKEEPLAPGLQDDEAEKVGCVAGKEIDKPSPP